MRLYEMFMGSLDKEKIWNTNAVSGCKRFLVRLYDMMLSDKVSEENTVEALKLGYKLVHGVEKDIEALQFNTAIAKMMEFVNDLSKLSAYPKKVLKMAVQALMPFAPHIAEEMWEILGCKEELFAYHPWPEVEAQYLVEDTVVLVVQVNGKVLGRFEVPKGTSKETALDYAKNDPNVSKFIDGKEVLKIQKKARILFQHAPNLLLVIYEYNNICNTMCFTNSSFGSCHAQFKSNKY